MFTDTDIHYIVGFLYVVSRRQDIKVVLGEKVYDEASESKRDVDIVIASVSDTAIIGIEVKNEGRPLDVAVVEGICQKFADMPEIKSKSIVSSSGYTAPAYRKAAKHGVECLKIVRGAIPPFPTIDLSKLKEITIERPTWIEGPQVVLLPNSKIPSKIMALIKPSTKVFYPKATVIDITTVKELGDRIAAIANGMSNEWELQIGNNNINFYTKIGDTPFIKIQGRKIEIDDARVVGNIQLMKETVSLEHSYYLEDSSKAPFAAVVLIETDNMLIGLSVANSGQEFRTFIVPDSIRKIRPIRKTIFPSSQ